MSSPSPANRHHTVHPGRCSLPNDITNMNPRSIIVRCDVDEHPACWFTWCAPLYNTLIYITLIPAFIGKATRYKMGRQMNSRRSLRGHLSAINGSTCSKDAVLSCAIGASPFLLYLDAWQPNPLFPRSQCTGIMLRIYQRMDKVEKSGTRLI